MPTTRRSTRWIVPLLLAPMLLPAQNEQAGSIARTLTPATKHADAARRFDEGLDALQALSFMAGARRLDEAVTADSTFGLARALRARARGGPTMSAELQRAAVDAVGGSPTEAVLAIAIREAAAGRADNARKLFDAAASLAPDDPRVALEAANARTGAERIAMLRDLSKRAPGFAPAKYWLAFYLTASPFGDTPRADLDEAHTVAHEALQLAPNAPGSHTMLAHVLARQGLDDQAMTHLGHATAMPASGEYAYVVRAELAARRGQTPLMRASLDSATALAANAGFHSQYRRARALANLHEGNLRETIRELATLASEDEAAGRRMAAATHHLWLALMNGVARDNAAIERHLGEAQRLGATGATLHDNQVITYFLAGNAPAARKALDEYLAATREDTSTSRKESISRLTGLVLIAEKRPREAIEVLKKGGLNPYAQLGLVEAYHAAGDRKAAKAERDAFLARRSFSYNSTAMPIGKYRMKAMKM